MAHTTVRPGLLAAVAVSCAIAPASLAAGRGAVAEHTMVARPGVVFSVDAKDHRFGYRSSGTSYTVHYSAATVWSALLEKNLAKGWHVIVRGELTRSTIAATKVVNDPRPERAACKSDAMTVDVATQAYEATTGKTPSTVASLVPEYLQRAPGNRPFYRIALDWGGKPAREGGGSHPGDVFVAPVWIGRVGKYRDFTVLGATVCNAAT